MANRAKGQAGGIFTRRDVLRYGGAAAALAASSPALIGRAAQRRIWDADPFSLGVASGSPGSDGFVLWTRLAPEPMNYDPETPAGMSGSAVPVAYEIARDPEMNVILKRGNALADPAYGYSVHVEIAGLAPGRPYWYRFMS